MMRKFLAVALNLDFDAREVACRPVPDLSEAPRRMREGQLRYLALRAKDSVLNLLRTGSGLSGLRVYIFGRRD